MAELASTRTGLYFNLDVAPLRAIRCSWRLKPIAILDHAVYPSSRLDLALRDNKQALRGCKSVNALPVMTALEAVLTPQNSQTVARTAQYWPIHQQLLFVTLGLVYLPSDAKPVRSVVLDHDCPLLTA